MWMPQHVPDLARLAAVHIQPVPVLPVIGFLFLVTYGAGVLRLRRRGVHWPLGRTVAWLSGVIVLWMVTATGIEGYGMELLSAHMFQHMVLTMVVPILLLIGAPFTLALRALPTTGPGGRCRRGLLSALHSRALTVLVSIPVRWFLFLSGLYAIYFTPLFDDLMSNVWGHNVMLLHFLFSGLLFFLPLIGADPVRQRTPHLFRMLEAFASTPFHAFFGVIVMMASTPLVTFYQHPPPTWGIDVMSDQNLAGGIAWGSAELPTLMVLGVIFVGWFGTERRTNARRDRAIDRGDNELAAYNERLAAMARNDAVLAVGEP